MYFCFSGYNNLSWKNINARNSRFVIDLVSYVHTVSSEKRTLDRDAVVGFCANHMVNERTRELNYDIYLYLHGLLYFYEKI